MAASSKRARKSAQKASEAATSLRSNPYVQRLIEDEELRDGVELGLDLEELSESLELPADVIGARLEGLGLEPGNGATLGLD